MADSPPSCPGGAAVVAARAVVHDRVRAMLDTNLVPPLLSEWDALDEALDALIVAAVTPPQRDLLTDQLETPHVTSDTGDR